MQALHQWRANREEVREQASDETRASPPKAGFDLISESTIDLFLLTAHIIVFGPQTQKLELPTN